MYPTVNRYSPRNGVVATRTQPRDMIYGTHNSCVVVNIVIRVNGDGLHISLKHTARKMSAISSVTDKGISF